MSNCADCKHFRRAPDEVKRDGCYHPELMRASQKDAYLDEQQIPGDHKKLNLRGDCKKFEARERPPAWWRLLLSA
jgi:hypothetical protein